MIFPMLLLILLVLSDVDCGKLGNIDHGEVKLTDGRTTHGATAVYTCATNYTLMGNAQRTCGDGGVWTGDSPQCLCKYHK